MLTGMAQFSKVTHGVDKDHFEKHEQCKLRISDDEHLISIPEVALSNQADEIIIKIWPFQICTSAGCLHIHGRKYLTEETYDLFFWPKNNIPIQEEEEEVRGFSCKRGEGCKPV